MGLLLFCWCLLFVLVFNWSVLGFDSLRFGFFLFGVLVLLWFEIWLAVLWGLILVILVKFLGW